MPALLEPFDDLIALGPHIDLILSGVPESALSSNVEVVAGRQIGSAFQHLAGSTVPRLFSGFYLQQMSAALLEEYWTVQIAFKWDRQPVTQTAISVDLFTVGPFGLKLFLTPSNKASGAQTFVAAAAQANDSSLSAFTSISVGTTKMLQGSWYVARARFRIHPTLGSYNISITRDLDGAEIQTFSGSNVNTTGAVNLAGATSVIMRTVPGMAVDDLKITTGVSDNAISDVESIFFRRVTFAGSSSQWAKSDAGLENFQHVDETSLSSINVDGDTLSASSVGTQDLYGFETVPATIPSSATIPRVNISFYGSGSPARTFQALHRTGGGVDSLIPVAALGVLPGPTQRRTFDAPVNPNGGGPWTVADLNPSQFGFRIIS